MRPFSLNSISLSVIIISWLALSCNNDSKREGEIDQSINNSNDTTQLTSKTVFPLKSDSTRFNLNAEQHVSFGGDLSIKNMSGYIISDIQQREAIIEIKWVDGTVLTYQMMIIVRAPENNKWGTDSNIKMEMGINPFKENAPYLMRDDFNRTPQSVQLNLSLNAINVDKETPIILKIDLLPKWKDFQTKIGLR